MRRTPKALVALLFAGHFVSASPAQAQSLLYTFDGENPGDELGLAVAVLDDLDGDGHPDFAIGARYVETPAVDAGRVYVRSGATGALIRTHSGAEAGDQFGFKVAAIGDLDGDGVGELIVGAPYHHVADHGAVTVYSGATGDVIHALVGATPERFGQTVGNAGDVDGDGVDDILIGAPGYNGAAGRAYAYSGASGALLHTLTNDVQVAGDEFGISVGGLGDLDGDGRSDFLVGAFLDENGFLTNAGSASLFSGATGARLAIFRGDASGWVLGRSVLKLGDIDGDGLTEFVIGGNGNGSPTDNPPFGGIARVYSGAPGHPVLYQVTGTYNAAFGGSLTAIDDLDGDGIDDFAVGAYNGNLTLQGYARVYSGADGALLLQLNGDGLQDRFAYTMASGDLDLDGAPELLIGAFQDDDGGANAGRVKVFTMPVAPPMGGGAALALELADCQDDADPAPGYQVAVELHVADLDASGATGFYAALSYDLGVLAYRGDLSGYTATPFPLHISSLLQGDDGSLDLDGSVSFGGSPTTVDALLATLVFDVVGAFDPFAPPVGFDLAAPFGSELSLAGSPIATTLVDPSPVTFDDTPPVLDACPTAIVQAADASLVDSCAGAIVTFSAPTATDELDPAPAVVCSPPSGSFFAVGQHVVVCTATDACGNESTCQFTVEVTATNLLSVDVELEGVFAAVTRCLHFVTEGCVGLDAPVDFADHDANPMTPVRGTAQLEVPCGPYDATTICVKDEQHTKWASSTVSLAGTIYVADLPITLEGGDTDNDGDIDINDVTLLLGQFGQLAHPGGCGWDGTRDADFDDNGAIGSEDYQFLTAGWLTTSSCECALLFGGHGYASASALTRVQARNTAQQMADLNRDGWVDVLDVEVLERRHGLSGELSRRIRTR